MDTVYIPRPIRLDMHHIVSAIRKLFSSNASSKEDADRIIVSFQKRYHCFRTLLTANNNALHAMAELEKMYYSGDSYRMAEVRTKISAIFVNVFKMIRNIRDMSDGRYDELESRFQKISEEIEMIIDRKIEVKSGPCILPLEKVSRMARDQTGDKMAVLGELSQLEFVNVPKGFVITATATRKYLTPSLLQEINRRLQIEVQDDLRNFEETCSELQRLVKELPIPEDLQKQIKKACQVIVENCSSDPLFAMRSSAIGEDAPGISFAGLYRTLLDVSPENLISAYKEVIAGKYSARAIGYRRQRGFRHEDIEMCVGCLEMVEAQVSGVVYSRDPTAPEGSNLRINSASGIARGVVDGTVATDLFVLRRRKPHYYVTPGGIAQNCTTYMGRRQKTPLTHRQIMQLSDTALRLEEYFNCPQDIEWSIDRAGKLYILQSRPLLSSQEIGLTDNRADFNEIGEPPPFLTGGICAAAGVACGKVARIGTVEQSYSFPQGAILVIDIPLPDWAYLLSRASAVLAQHGTEAGHLATVSREFGIPALFSLKGVMAEVEDGQVLTVDSVNKKIYHGCREDVLSNKKVRRDLMAGSPVQRILTDALQYITPLNLTEPGSINFKASWCETLHDITRYCHEKSVAEMFHFTKLNKLKLGQAKRLIGDTPMEWWVINLADGFKQDIAQKQKYIRIEDITSLPMLEIWSGITAFPWSGPPPITARAFGSILLQSTMRPELEPSVASPLTAKNYFLISKRFCNLSVRLGYHYAMIESYFGDLLTENYITFRFKGGAADLRRKAMRAKLLSEILMRYEFKVEVRSDALLARVKKQPLEFLKTRLQILGYLTLHTRQLDMVMSQMQTVEQYKNRFISEIETMLSSGDKDYENSRTNSGH